MMGIGKGGSSRVSLRGGEKDLVFLYFFLPFSFCFLCDDCEPLRRSRCERIGENRWLATTGTTVK